MLDAAIPQQNVACACRVAVRMHFQRPTDRTRLRVCLNGHIVSTAAFRGKAVIILRRSAWSQIAITAHKRIRFFVIGALTNETGEIKVRVQIAESAGRPTFIRWAYNYLRGEPQLVCHERVIGPDQEPLIGVCQKIFPAAKGNTFLCGVEVSPNP